MDQFSHQNNRVFHRFSDSVCDSTWWGEFWQALPSSCQRLPWRCSLWLNSSVAQALLNSKLWKHLRGRICVYLWLDSRRGESGSTVPGQRWTKTRRGKGLLSYVITESHGSRESSRPAQLCKLPILWSHRLTLEDRTLKTAENCCNCVSLQSSQGTQGPKLQ